MFGCNVGSFWGCMVRYRCVVINHGNNCAVTQTRSLGAGRRQCDLLHQHVSRVNQSTIHYVTAIWPNLIIFVCLQYTQHTEIAKQKLLHDHSWEYSLKGVVVDADGWPTMIISQSVFEQLFELWCCCTVVVVVFLHGFCGRGFGAVWRMGDWRKWEDAFCGILEEVSKLASTDYGSFKSWLESAVAGNVSWKIFRRILSSWISLD